MNIEEWKKKTDYKENCTCKRACGTCKYSIHEGDHNIIYCKKMLGETDSKDIKECKVDYYRSFCRNLRGEILTAEEWKKKNNFRNIGSCYDCMYHIFNSDGTYSCQIINNDVDSFGCDFRIASSINGTINIVCDNYEGW